METATDKKIDRALEREIFIRSQMRRKQINAAGIAANHGWDRSTVNKQIKGVPISREEEVVAMKIICKKDRGPNGKQGFSWAWQESADQGVWGWCPTIDAVMQMARRMFPGVDIELCIS